MRINPLEGFNRKEETSRFARIKECKESSYFAGVVGRGGQVEFLKASLKVHLFDRKAPYSRREVVQRISGCCEVSFSIRTSL